jgi:hypothetical protein
MLSFLLIVWLEPVHDTAALVVPIAFLAPVWFAIGLFAAIRALTRYLDSPGGTTDVSGSRHLVISMVLNLIWLVFILVALFKPFHTLNSRPVLLMNLEVGIETLRPPPAESLARRTILTPLRADHAPRGRFEAEEEETRVRGPH